MHPLKGSSNNGHLSPVRTAPWLGPPGSLEWGSQAPHSSYCTTTLRRTVYGALAKNVLCCSIQSMGLAETAVYSPINMKRISRVHSIHTPPHCITGWGLRTPFLVNGGGLSCACMIYVQGGSRITPLISLYNTCHSCPLKTHREHLP